MNKNITCLKNKTKPIVAIVGCVHGDELIGKKIIEALKKIKIKRGALMTIIGNEKALKLKQRFVDQDLNRSFPGKERGNYEEHLAYILKNKIASADYVIDIHSTITTVKNLAIITRKNKKTLELINLLSPRRVALIDRVIGKKALTYYCKAGISLEYGKDGDRLVYDKILKDIMVLLKKLGMINFKTKMVSVKPELYRINETIKKQNGFKINNEIKNFKLIKKGDLIASSDSKSIKAKTNFYPILFGKNSYKDIYGFTAKKVGKF